jgi:hypothetical protein
LLLITAFLSTHAAVQRDVESPSSAADPGQFNFSLSGIFVQYQIGSDNARIGAGEVPPKRLSYAAHGGAGCRGGGGVVEDLELWRSLEKLDFVAGNNWE